MERYRELMSDLIIHFMIHGSLNGWKKKKYMRRDTEKKIACNLINIL
jgi:hypothetical protein